MQNVRNDVPKIPTRQDLQRVENSKQIAKELNETIQPDSLTAKQRSWIEISTESGALKDKVLIKDLDSSKINYVPISNITTLEKANNSFRSMSS